MGTAVVIGQVVAGLFGSVANIVTGANQTEAGVAGVNNDISNKQYRSTFWVIIAVFIAIVLIIYLIWRKNK